MKMLDVACLGPVDDSGVWLGIYQLLKFRSLFASGPVKSQSNLKP